MSSANHIGSTYRGPSLHGQVVQELGSRIAGGRYAPGAVLPPEEELCVELGVSRTALREAIKVLAAKGLVESRPRVGTRVRANILWNQLDPDVLAWRCGSLPDAMLLAQLTEMREIIEPAAAQLAARNRTPEQMVQIDAALAAMTAARRIGPWVEADVAFHRAVLGATGNALLMSLAALIATALESLLGVSARRASDFRIGLADHVRVRDAIRAHDTQAAGQFMQLLLADTRRRLLPAAASAAKAADAADAANAAQAANAANAAIAANATQAAGSGRVAAERAAARGAGKRAAGGLGPGPGSESAAGKRVPGPRAAVKIAPAKGLAGQGAAGAGTGTGTASVEPPATQPARGHRG